MEDDLDQLFAAPLDRFIETRDQIVRQLRREGFEEEAAAVAAIRKPSVSVWVVNQLARSASDDLTDLAEAGERLEAVQRAAMTGGAITGYPEARAREAGAIARLEKAARQVLPSITTQTQERVLTTLRAGAASTEGRAVLVGGRLHHDLEPVGFDLFAAGFQPPAPKPAPASKSDEASRRELEALRSQARQVAEDAEMAAANAQRAADEAEVAERRARRAKHDAASAAEHAESTRSHATRLAAQVARAEAERASPGEV